MPWGQVRSSNYRPAMDPLLEIDICKRLGQVLEYVTLYRKHGELDNEVVYKLLLHNSTPDELQAYLILLEDHRDEDGGSGELAKALLALRPPSEQEMARTVVILSCLFGGHTPWSTFTVDQLHALPNA